MYLAGMHTAYLVRAASHPQPQPLAISGTYLLCSFFRIFSMWSPLLSQCSTRPRPLSALLTRYLTLSATQCRPVLTCASEGCSHSGLVTLSVALVSALRLVLVYRAAPSTHLSWPATMFLNCFTAVSPFRNSLFIVTPIR